MSVLREFYEGPLSCESLLLLQYFWCLVVDPPGPCWQPPLAPEEDAASEDEREERDNNCHSRTNFFDVAGNNLIHLFDDRRQMSGRKNWPSLAWESKGPQFELLVFQPLRYNLASFPGLHSRSF